MAAAMNRRELFAKLRGGPQQTRPPWSKPEGEFTERCIRCSACADACPEHIIVPGHAGYPIINFSHGGCTLCGACALACTSGCFEGSDNPSPWTLKASIGSSCIEIKGIVCRMCEESCAAGAITFRPRPGGRAQGIIDEKLCTGCGSCVAICPVKAITASPKTTEPRETSA